MKEREKKRLEDVDSQSFNEIYEKFGKELLQLFLSGV